MASRAASPSLSSARNTSSAGYQRDGPTCGPHSQSVDGASSSTVGTPRRAARCVGTLSSPTTRPYSAILAASRSTGTAFQFEDGDSGLQFHVNKSEVTQFMSEFRASTTLRLEFVGSNLADWSLSLAGTARVSDAFLTCNSGLK